MGRKVCTETEIRFTVVQKRSRWLHTAFTGPDWPLADSFLGNYFGLWPILWIDRHHRTTEAFRVMQLPVLQLIFIAIAPACTDLVWAEALEVVVDRIVTTAQVAANVAEWKGT